MSPRLHRALDSLNPARGGPGLELRAFRFAALVTAVSVPAFGWLYHATDAGAVDSLLARAGIAVVALVLVGLSYVSEAVRHRASAIHAVSMHTVVAYVGWLVVVNGLSATYALGYLFTFVAVALSLSLAETRPGPFAAHLAFSTGIMVAALALVPEPQVTRAVFVACWGGLGALQLVAVVARAGVQKALTDSERRLAKAERLARTGSWEHDIRTGRRVWSDGLYRLTGRSPDSPAVSIIDIIHPADQAYTDSIRKAMLAEGRHAEFQVRIVTAEGEFRTLRSVVDLERDRAGQPLRFTSAVLDVTEQVRREDALRQARDQAEEGARAKSAFLANMSHEIRTPLTAIIGFAQLLGEETGPEHRDLVEPIESGGMRLLDTLNSVLDLARMDAGHTDLAATAVDVGAEVRAVVQMLGPSAAYKGIALAADVPADTPTAHADRAAFSRVLTNLVSNAVKFTDAGGVTVSARPVLGTTGIPAGVEVRVADTGCGMSPAFLATIYEPFQQASTGWARSHEGTGLGLTITHRLVESMGGQIAVESRVGQGTTFTVVLPASAVSAGMPASVPACVAACVPAVSARAPAAV